MNGNRFFVNITSALMALSVSASCCDLTAIAVFVITLCQYWWHASWWFKLLWGQRGHINTFRMKPYKKGKKREELSMCEMMANTSLLTASFFLYCTFLSSFCKYWWQTLIYMLNYYVYLVISILFIFFKLLFAIIKHSFKHSHIISKWKIYLFISNIIYTVKYAI